jgi:uncharacterized membrane protein YfcA
MFPLPLLLAATGSAMPPWPPAAAVAAGVVVGLSLGLTGGGGAIFAVPLLVYWIGVEPTTAVGISLLTVATTAAVGVVERWRYGQVEWPTGLLFAAAGMLTAPLGSWLGNQIPEQPLLISFALLMLVIAFRMWRKARDVEERLPPADVGAGSGPACRRDPEGKLRLTSRCATVLGIVGLLVGLLSGLYGVGGGFLIVPALVTFAAMGVPRAVGTSLLVMTLVGISGVSAHAFAGREIPLPIAGGFLIVPALVTFAAMGVPRAVGTSLLVMTLVGISGVSAHAFAGREIPLPIAGGFVAGSIPGLFLGSAIGRRLTGPLLARLFAIAIVLVAAFVIGREVLGS